MFKYEINLTHQLFVVILRFLILILNYYNNKKYVIIFSYYLYYYIFSAFLFQANDITNKICGLCLVKNVKTNAMKPMIITTIQHHSITTVFMFVARHFGMLQNNF